MNKKNRIALIIVVSIMLVSIMFIVEQVLMMPYIYKTLIKIPMFIGIPFIIKRLILGEKFKFYMTFKHFKIVLLWSFMIMSVIVLAYFIAKSFIDPTHIISDFKERMEISNTLIIFVAIYTIFVNAFIEEYFFRAFVFQSLNNKKLRKTSYILSSVLFAIYHVGIFMTWFSLPIMILVLFGLFIGGVIFSRFVEITESVFASYMIHLSADIAIILIGFYGLNLFAL